MRRTLPPTPTDFDPVALNYIMYVELVGAVRTITNTIVNLIFGYRCPSFETVKAFIIGFIRSVRTITTTVTPRRETVVR